MKAIGMRVLDTHDMRVVHAGQQWPFPGIDPSTKGAMRLLERNEALVTWVQPIGGTVDDQLPTVHVRDDIYYVLSLRSMKIVFRHIRLCKSFVNRERTVFGEWKLRIPMCLLREKIRTQMRFNALRDIHMKRGGKSKTAGVKKTQTSSVHKIAIFVEQTVLGFDPSKHEWRLPLSFASSEPTTLSNMLDLVQSECPRLLRNHGYFISKLSLAYKRRFEQGHGHSN